MQKIGPVRVVAFERKPAAQQRVDLLGRQLGQSMGQDHPVGRVFQYLQHVQQTSDDNDLLLRNQIIEQGNGGLVLKLQRVDRAVPMGHILELPDPFTGILYEHPPLVQ